MIGFRAVAGFSSKNALDKIRSRSFIVNNLLSKRGKKSKKYSTKYIWLCKPGNEIQIENELRSNLKINESNKHNGWLDCTLDNKTEYEPTWSLQTIPQYDSVKRDSVKSLASDCADYVISKMKDDPNPWLVHSLVGDKQLNGRMKLVQETFLDVMKEKRRKLHRLLKTEDCDADVTTDLPTPGEHLVQMFMKSKDEIAISHSILNYSFYWHKPLPFVGGLAPTPTTKLPPSYAYKKIEEIFQHLNITSLQDQTVAELGNFPGGWTWCLLDKGALVESVDKAALVDPQLTKNSRLKHHVGDAKKWMPEQPVDWLFTDVSIPPDHSLLVLENWIKEKKMKCFVWTIKFVGDEQHIPVLKEIRNLFEKHKECEYVVRHLAYHGNEICIMGRFK